jgi:hypothetical protein
VALKVVPNPFLLRILKTSAARTLLLAMVTFATLLFFGCANGGYIYTSGQRQNTFGQVVSHKIVLLSIGQKTREIKRARRTRSTTVLGHLDATTAPICRRGVVAFALHGGFVRRWRRLDGDHSSRSEDLDPRLLLAPFRRASELDAE